MSARFDRRAVERCLADLDRECADLDAKCEGALAAYDYASTRDEIDRAWAAYTAHADAYTELHRERLVLRATLAEHEQAEIERTHGPEVRR